MNNSRDAEEEKVVVVVVVVVLKRRKSFRPGINGVLLGSL